MRTSSVLFCPAGRPAVFGNVLPWAFGAPIRITALFICAVALSVVLCVFLWRLQRWAAVVGLIVALADLLVIGGATYFLWPSVRTSLRSRIRPSTFSHHASSLALNAGRLWRSHSAAL